MSATRVLFTVISLVFFLQFCKADRKISKEIIPGPNGTDSKYTVAHITAAGTNDELHYLISTLGYPTILVAHTEPNTHININWDKFTNESSRGESITFTGKVLYSYAVFFTKLIDYNDTKDYADLTKYTPESTEWNIYNLNEFSWESLSEDSKDFGNAVEFKASNTSFEELWQYDGKFTIKLTPYEGSGRETDLPHLEYSENITQFDLTIDHVWTNFTKSRFAIEMVMVGGDATPMDIDESRSIDDEYTPGVFYINNLLTKPNQNTGGFLQWKPVCYKKLSRSRGVATFVRHYKLQSLTSETFDVIKTSLLYAINGDGVNTMARSATNISLGLTEDGGYNKTQVLTWTASLGYGEPPVDSVSTIVIIIISSGLGIPVILILFGGLFVCYKKKSNNSEKNAPNGYQRIGTN